uniref:Uncharacterized protein n=1 Tax=Ananas comosus var. bracteatus TaxID=296719 RepID=A0A6V7QG70_ANACO|nr:unnamed protein product [Ananas comosus var. bracteatus]
MRSSSSSHGDAATVMVMATAMAMRAMERGRELRSLLMASRPGDSAAEGLVDEVLGSIAARDRALGSGDGAAAGVRRRRRRRIGLLRRWPERGVDGEEEGEPGSATIGGEDVGGGGTPTIPQILEPPLPGDSYLISFKSDHATELPKSEAAAAAAAAAVKPSSSSFKQDCDEDVLSSITPAASSQAECSLLPDQLAAIVGDCSGNPFEGLAIALNEGDVTSGFIRVWTT